MPIALATESLNITYLASTEIRNRYTNSTFQMVPRLNDFSQALLDLVKKYGWNEVSIFFDDNKGKFCYIFLLIHAYISATSATRSPHNKIKHVSQSHSFNFLKVKCICIHLFLIFMLHIW